MDAQASLPSQGAWAPFRLFKKWVLDGWITSGPQIATSPDTVRTFTVCTDCGRVFPHWLASMTAQEAKKRGKLGCWCGGLRLKPQLLPAWKSIWWFCVRGYLVRHLLLRRRLWDPRMPILHYDRD